MEIHQNVSLRSYSTMRLGGKADYLAEVKTNNQLKELINWSKKHHQPIIMIGGGSNIIWQDQGFQGLVLINKIKGLETEIVNDKVIFKIGAGEIWDQIVEKSVNLNLSGIESLSYIPGLAGGTIIQNVGAYGQEIKDTLLDVEVYDLFDQNFKLLSLDECRLGYRSSLFKNIQPRRYLITSFRLALNRTKPPQHLYETLDKYFEDHQILQITPQTIRQAVIEIRKSKLPDPTKIGNCGSFFANPVISKDDFHNLPDEVKLNVSHWLFENQIKLSAAWLIDYVGLSNFQDYQTGFGIWPKQSLIVVNNHGKSSQDLLKFKNHIIDKVYQKTKINLTMEPEFLPN